MNRLQISLLVISEFKRINFYSPWNHQEIIGLLMVSREAEFSSFAKISLILEEKYGDDP